MRLFAIVVAGLAMLCANTAAAQVIADPSPRARELAARYVELADLRGTMLAQMQGASGLEDEMAAGFAALGMPVKGDAGAGVMPSFVPEGSMDGMEPMIAFVEEVLVQAISETYSEPELEALVAFYETEIGRSILGRQAELETRMTGLMFERMPEMLAAMGIDPDRAAALCGLGGTSSVDPYAGVPTRQMQTRSPDASGMTLDDLMLYGASGGWLEDLPPELSYED